MAAKAAEKAAVLCILCLYLLTHTGHAQEDRLQEITGKFRAWIPGSKKDLPQLLDNDANTEVYEAKSYRIDLGKEYVISQIQLDGDEYQQLRIAVSKRRRVSSDDNCWIGFMGLQPVMQCSKKGRFVTISKYRSGPNLKLKGVKFFECSSGYYGRGCQNKCHCADGAACDNINGHCPTKGCAPGYTGEECNRGCKPGSFGAGCTRHCHCAVPPTCDIVTGLCESCATIYLGDTCETRTPKMLRGPKQVRSLSTNTSIGLKWDTPTDIRTQLDHNVTFYYQIKYRLFNSQEDWQNGPDLPHDPQNKPQNGVVAGLQRDTFYEFRIAPHVELEEKGQSEDFEGQPSEASVAMKTMCAAPIIPKIESVSSEQKFHKRKEDDVTVTVRWKMLTQKNEMNCENMHYYIVEYNEEGANDSFIVHVSPRRSDIELPGLKFSTKYKVKVIGQNNQRLQSGGMEEEVITVPKVAMAPQTFRQSENPTPTIAGVLIAVLVLVAAVVGLLLYRRHRARKYFGVPKVTEKNGIHSALAKGTTPENVSLLDSGVVDASSSDNTPSSTLDVVEEVPKEPPVTPVSHVIKVEDLEAFVQKGRSNNSQILRKEYEELPMGFTMKCDIGKKLENRHKNRFVNVVAYDHSRVVLDTINDDADSDYINANHIDGYKKPKLFIAAQGCNKYTVQDMWRMMWQVKSGRIIMVTNLVENAKRKCDQYWPENGEKTYGDIKVQLTETEQTADYCIRTFNIARGEETRNIKQLHFTAWPDHGVPSQAIPIIAFRRKVRSYDKSHPGPIIVHCSAGVGRTGTYIAIDTLLEQAKHEGEIDLYSLTRKMRRDRVNMIQTVEQYMFVYSAVLEALKAGNTSIPLAKYEDMYKELSHPEEGKEKSKLQEQFEILEAMSPKVKPEECKDGRLPENAAKNRDISLIPSDRFRPFLRTPVEGTNDYIAATFLDGYRSRNGYVISQMPLPITVIDMWRMVLDHDIGCIVMLNPFDEDDESYGQYWDDDGISECGPISIEHISTDTSNVHVTIRKMKITYQPQSPSIMPSKKESQPRVVCQFQLNGWPVGRNVPESTEGLVGLLDLVEGWQYQTGYSPILVHCNDGGKASGLFTAAACLFEKMKVELEVDAFQMVKQLRQRRPQVISNSEQYEYLFELVLEYVKEFETYANFR